MYAERWEKRAKYKKQKTKRKRNKRAIFWIGRTPPRLYTCDGWLRTVVYYHVRAPHSFRNFGDPNGSEIFACSNSIQNFFPDVTECSLVIYSITSTRTIFWLNRNFETLAFSTREIWTCNWVFVRVCYFICSTVWIWTMCIYSFSIFFPYLCIYWSIKTSNGGKHSFLFVSTGLDGAPTIFGTNDSICIIIAYAYLFVICFVPRNNFQIKCRSSTVGGCCWQHKYIICYWWLMMKACDNLCVYFRVPCPNDEHLFFYPYANT